MDVIRSIRSSLPYKSYIIIFFIMGFLHGFIVLSIGSPLKNIWGWYEMYDIICPAHPSQRAAIGPAGASGSHGQLGTEESYLW